MTIREMSEDEVEQVAGAAKAKFTENNCIAAFTLGGIVIGAWTGGLPGAGLGGALGNAVGGLLCDGLV